MADGEVQHGAAAGAAGGGYGELVAKLSAAYRTMAKVLACSVARVHPRGS